MQNPEESEHVRKIRISQDILQLTEQGITAGLIALGFSSSRSSELPGLSPAVTQLSLRRFSRVSNYRTLLMFFSFSTRGESWNIKTHDTTKPGWVREKRDIQKSVSKWSFSSSCCLTVLRSSAAAPRYPPTPPTSRSVQLRQFGVLCFSSLLCSLRPYFLFVCALTCCVIACSFCSDRREHMLRLKKGGDAEPETASDGGEMSDDSRNSHGAASASSSGGGARSKPKVAQPPARSVTPTIGPTEVKADGFFFLDLILVCVYCVVYIRACCQTVCSVLLV